MSKESEANLGGVAGQTQEILKGIAKDSAEKAGALREKMEGNLRTAMDRLRDIEAATVNRTRLAARATNEYVHANPWRTIAAAVGIGFLVALLMPRRDR